MKFVGLISLGLLVGGVLSVSAALAAPKPMATSKSRTRIHPAPKSTPSDSIYSAFAAKYGHVPAGKRIAVYQDAAGSWSENIAAGLSRRLRVAGFTVCRLSDDELTDSAVLNARVLPVLILVNSTTVPEGAVATINQYAHGGGFLVSLGGPAFSNLQFKWRGVSLDRSSFIRKVISALSVKPLRRWGDNTRWERSTNEPKEPARVQRIAGPEGVRHGYQFTYKHFTGGWDLFQIQTPAPPRNNTLTVFWAKGNKTTKALYVEWRQRDGGFWQTTVPLTTRWKRYVIAESGFSYWPHPAIPGRGGPGDHLHLVHSREIRFGLVGYLMPPPVGGPHSFCLAGVGTASIGALPEAAVARRAFRGIPMPIISSISPAYKLFPVTDMKTVAVNSSQVMAPPAVLPLPTSLLGLYPRAQGDSFDQQLATRYVPLLEARGRNGRFVAVAAALELPSAAAAPQQGIMLSMPIRDPSFFASPIIQRWLAQVIKRVKRGIYLADGGTGETTCFTGMTMPVGAAVINRGGSAQMVRVETTITASDGKIVFQHTFTGTMAAHCMKKFRTLWRPPAAAGWESLFHVTTVLRVAGQIVDRLQGKVRVLGKVRHPHFVTAAHGLFYLRGKPWYAFGVNFWPESSMAQENWGLYQSWLSRAAYDPQTVRRNLDDVKALGFNTISIAYDRRDNPWNLLDVLAQARKLGLKVNLSLAGIDGLPGESGGPGTFQLKPVKRLMDLLHLPENSTVFAYDIAWEPHWGSHRSRSRFDPLWRRWIIKHYGSIKHAEVVWRCPVPRQHGRITNPLDRQFVAGGHGKAALMIRAYNRFLDGLLKRCYGRARALIRRMDPHHLVSFRMSMAGDPGRNPYYDYGFYNFQGLRHVVDIFEPEGYGVMTTRRRAGDKIIFTVQYARAVNPSLPVVYAEFGVSAWNHQLHRDTISGEEHVAQVYTRFYKSVLRAGANGAICWWFPGGYRYGERSDYGIINPDRSWRPVSYVIHEFAKQMKAPRPLPVPNVWIPIRRGHVRGVRGIWEDIKVRFQAAIEAGKLPGLKIVK